MVNRRDRHSPLSPRLDCKSPPVSEPPYQYGFAVLLMSRCCTAIPTALVRSLHHSGRSAEALDGSGRRADTTSGGRPQPQPTAPPHQICRSV